ncbi:chorismate mutase [Caproiciproducens galactitolivorans]|uniref:Bifunctional chorismate mutase/prephenate dehydratase n=1 Tax=Caproiciproducens galactitolivorans TaxID=642589 RepID=A0ABT4BSJ5_9FIRM|nr:chorismate mutase [Caproiciproducens galactitolivorans]MCY1713869.1 chorismate mutase [Caproiciproducens galactitolivorans]
MTLEEIRKEIDQIDEALLPLFLKRMECAKKVAAIKKESGQPVLNTEREQAILDRIGSRAGEYGGEARLLYSNMMDMSRSLQHSLLGSGRELRATIRAAGEKPEKAEKIACLGEIGSYSHEALEQLYPHAFPQFHSDFGGIFAAVESGDADLGLLPVENSSAGSVGEVYDLILQYRYSIVAATTLLVRHCMASAKKVDAHSIATVYSHPQALSQCSEYIEKNDLHAMPCSSTAAAAQMIAQRQEAGIAAICSEHAARQYKLHILENDIQNSSNNRTRFIVISRRLFIPGGAQKISLCFSLLHKTGSLYSVLARFAAAGLNLTKIESRPIAGKNFEYDFYLDFTGNVHEERTLNLLCALNDELPRFSFLGNYIENE